MTKIIASSLLVIGVLIIRAVFQKKISPVFIYPIWLLVAVRLLMPGMFLFSPISVMNARLWNMGSTLIAEEENRQEQEYKLQQYREYYSKMAAELESAGEKEETDGVSSGYEVKTAAETEKEVGTEHGIEAGGTKQEAGYLLTGSNWQGTFFGRIRQLARIVWIAGMLVTALSFLGQNLSFYRYLRSTRKKLRESVVRGRKISVFQAGEKLTSPCLFGIYPAIYIPEGSIDIKNEEQLSFALEHELTHYRHGDHIWALVRILCLVINWYNPLTWVAAKLSLRDGELACDADCIRRLGEEKRFAYGEALLAVIRQSGEKERVLKTATMMTAGRKFMERRMESIARKRKSSVIALAVMILSLLFMAGYTYTGVAKLEEDRTDGTEATAETNPVQKKEIGEKASKMAIYRGWSF